MSLKAAPSWPISSRAPAGARASKSPSPTRRAATASWLMGRMTTRRMATVSTPAAATIVTRPIRIWRLRCRRTSASTGSIEVSTRTTARTR